MSLQELAAAHAEAALHGADPAQRVSDIVYDSRGATPGALFVALRGGKSDGLAHVDDARRRGAVAVLADRPPGVSIPWIEARAPRAALADLAARFFERPAERLTLAGVTGTNGKTTTAFLIEAGLRHAGITTGLFGTVETRIASRPIPATLTTPESLDLHRAFRAMVDEGVTHVAMEVSSHALLQERVRGLRFQTAVFTNLTRDHLDFHGDMDSYWEAKRLLFTGHLKDAGVAVLAADDERGREFARQLPAARRRTFGLSEDADYRAENVRLSLGGTRFSCRMPDGLVEIDSPLVGEFNVRNLLGAFGALRALGLSADAAARGVGSLDGVPGRMQRIEAGQDFTVLVDFAHTDDALKNVLDTVRGLNPRRVITVFGCGGDRDRTKRPLMGAVAARRSDFVVATSDNPRSESPEAILDEVAQGFRDQTAETRLVVDRAEAIRIALAAAGKGDAVVIAGKGHETTQILRTGKIPFDDRQVARAALQEILGGARARD